MQQLSIFKIGGKVIDNDNRRMAFLQSFAKFPGYKVLVHGGGNKATQLSQRLGLHTNMYKGRRITDSETLEVAVMVYAGLVNKSMVAELQAIGINASGYTGADQNCLRSVKRKVQEVDFGFVGDIEEVNTRAISEMILGGIVPVFCAITHDKKGQLLNTNADHIASSLGSALAGIFETRLYYVFEKKGVLSDPADENSVIHKIDREIYAAHLKSGIISDGMIPKLENAFKALDKGVSFVYICDAEAVEQGSMTNATTLCL